MLARPEVQSYQYSFAGSITLVFASGVGLCLGQPQLRGERRFERPRRGAEDQGRAARARNSGTGGRLRRPGQGEARGARPRTTLSSLADRLNDGRLPDGEVVANLESEIRKLYEVGGGVEADRQTLTPEDFAKVMELLKFRPMQLALVLKVLVGAEEMQRMMIQAIGEGSTKSTLNASRYSRTVEERRPTTLIRRPVGIRGDDSNPKFP